MIMLSSDDLEEVFPVTLACYQGKNLYCRGDGYNDATRYQISKEDRNGRSVTVRTGKSKKVKCPCNLLGASKGLTCKPHGLLWCTIIAGEETQIGARHSFRTTSWDSISSIIAGLQGIQEHVTLVGHPLTMIVKPRVVRPKGSDSSKTVYVVNITKKTSDVQKLVEDCLRQLQLRQAVSELAGQTGRAMPAPADGAETSAEQAKIQTEYHPDPAPDEDDEDLGYDPNTGEVYGDGDVLDTDGWERDPKPEDESQEEAPAPDDASNAQLPGDHPLRAAFQKLIGDIFVDRDLAEDEAKSGRSAIWSEACESAGCPRLPWKDLTRARAAKIQPHLQKMLRDPDTVSEGP